MLGKFLKRRKWRRSQKPSSDEYAVIRAILDGSGENYTKLMRQVEEAPYVQRSLYQHGTRFRLTVPQTTEDLLIPLDEDLESEEIVVKDKLSNASLRFKVVILRGGFFGFLEARREDGGIWSRDWSLGHDSLLRYRNTKPLLQLPSEDQLREVQERGQKLVSEWLGDSEFVRTCAKRLRFYPPVTQEDLDALAKREAVSPPDQLLELWNLTNGLSIGDLECLGSRDAKVVEGFPRGKLVAIADLREDGIVGILCDDPEDRHVYLVEPSITGDPSPTVIAPSIKEFIRESIRRVKP